MAHQHPGFHPENPRWICDITFPYHRLCHLHSIPQSTFYLHATYKPTRATPTTSMMMMKPTPTNSPTNNIAHLSPGMYVLKASSTRRQHPTPPRPHEHPNSSSGPQPPLPQAPRPFPLARPTTTSRPRRPRETALRAVHPAPRARIRGGGRRRRPTWCPRR
jgi:hypothetical protein